MEINKMAKPLIEFFVHIAIGTAIFLIVAVPVIALNYFVKWLEGSGVDQFIIYALTALQYSILIVDVLLLIIFLARSTLTLMRWERTTHNNQVNKDASR